jgi:hypothetical protein
MLEGMAVSWLWEKLRVSSFTSDERTEGKTVNLLPKR